MSYTRAYLNAEIDETQEPEARIVSDPADEALIHIQLDYSAFATKDAVWCRKAAAVFTRAAELLDEANHARKQATP